MRYVLLGALAVPLLVLPSTAQVVGSVPPAIVDVTASGGVFVPPTSTAFSPAAFESSSLDQIELRDIQGQPGMFRLAATVTGLRPALGAQGGSDVVEGVYDDVAKTIALSNRAASFNSSVTEFAFSISPDGLTAVCDRDFGPVWATRTSPADSFGTPQPITGLPPGSTFVDSKIYDDGGTVRYAFVDLTSGDILAGDFAAGTVSNIRTIVPTSSVPGALGLHSHHPVTDGQGTVYAWLLSVQWSTGDSDLAWLPARDHDPTMTNPATPQVLWSDSAWQNNATTIGCSGSVVSSWNGGGGDLLDYQLVACNGASYDAVQGSRVDLAALIPRRDAAANWAAALWLGFPSAPMPLAGLSFVIGNGMGSPGTGRSPALLAQLPALFDLSTASVAPGSGVATFSFRVPGLGSSAIGAPVSLQVLAIDIDNALAYLGNDANLEGQ